MYISDISFGFSNIKLKSTLKNINWYSIYPISYLSLWMSLKLMLDIFKSHLHKQKYSILCLEFSLKPILLNISVTAHFPFSFYRTFAFNYVCFLFSLFNNAWLHVLFYPHPPLTLQARCDPCFVTVFEKNECVFMNKRTICELTMVLPNKSNAFIRLRS